MNPLVTIRRTPIVMATVLVITVCVMIGLPPAGTVSAHTDFDYSLPTDGAAVGNPVSEVVVAFTDPVTLVGNGFTALDPQENVVEPFPVTDDDMVFRLQFDPPLAGGAVGIRYEVKAEDGHVLSGSFTFTVDAPVPTTVPPTSAPEVTDPSTTVASTVAPTTSPATTTTAAATPATDATSAPTAPTDSTDSTDRAGDLGATGDDGGPGTGTYIAIAAAVAAAAAGFLLVRSRTSGPQ